MKCFFLPMFVSHGFLPLLAIVGYISHFGLMAFCHSFARTSWTLCIARNQKMDSMCIGREKGSGQNQSFNLQNQLTWEFCKFLKVFLNSKNFAFFAFLPLAFSFFSARNQRKNGHQYFIGKDPYELGLAAHGKRLWPKPEFQYAELFSFGFGLWFLKVFLNSKNFAFFAFLPLAFSFFSARNQRKNGHQYFIGKDPYELGLAAHGKRLWPKPELQFAEPIDPGTHVFFIFFIFKNQRES